MLSINYLINIFYNKSEQDMLHDYDLKKIQIKINKKMEERQVSIWFIKIAGIKYSFYNVFFLNIYEMRHSEAISIFPVLRPQSEKDINLSKQCLFSWIQWIDK